MVNGLVILTFLVRGWAIQEEEFQVFQEYLWKYKVDNIGKDKIMDEGMEVKQTILTASVYSKLWTSTASSEWSVISYMNGVLREEFLLLENLPTFLKLRQCFLGRGSYNKHLLVRYDNIVHILCNVILLQVNTFFLVKL